MNADFLESDEIERSLDEVGPEIGDAVQVLLPGGSRGAIGSNREGRVDDVPGASVDRRAPARCGCVDGGSCICLDSGDARPDGKRVSLGIETDLRSFGVLG
jgi:hypothetical protein